MIVAVSGHRPPKLGGYYVPNPIYLNVREVLRTAFREQDDRATAAGDELMILSGMALGVDQWAAEICIEEGIKWTAVIPFHGFEGRWPDISKRHYHDLLNAADCVHVVTDTHEYRPNLLYRRNAWMVDNASLVLAIWNGTSGGTSNCIDYARRKRVRTEVLPVPLEIWDQARALERPTPQSSGSQLLMDILGPAPAPRVTSRLRTQMEQDNLEALRRQNITAVMNVDDRMRWGLNGPIEVLNDRYSPLDRAAMEDHARASLAALAQQGMVRAEFEARLAQPIDFIPLQINVDGVAITEEAVTQEHPMKEIITPEKRFLPGRIIDIED